MRIRRGGCTAKTAYAMNADGGAEPWEFQFGTESAAAGPTGNSGTPFLALNGHLRQEEDFSGDFTAQTGWLWRSVNGQTMRIGVPLSERQIEPVPNVYQDTEQQIGLGLWYDF